MLENQTPSGGLARANSAAGSAVGIAAGPEIGTLTAALARMNAIAEDALTAIEHIDRALARIDNSPPGGDTGSGAPSVTRTGAPTAGEHLSSLNDRLERVARFANLTANRASSLA